MEKHLSSRYRLRDSSPVIQDITAANVAVAYNQAGGDYVAYADGDPARPFLPLMVCTAMPIGTSGLPLRRN